MVFTRDTFPEYRDATVDHRGYMTGAQAQALSDATTKLATMQRPIVRLAATISADIATLNWTTAGVGLTVVAAQNFTVGSAASIFDGTVAFAAQVGGTAATKWGLAAIIDGSTVIPLGGATHNLNDYATLDSVPLILPALSAGVHTIRIDAVANVTGATLSFRPATQPLYEFCRIRILELAP